MEAQQGCLLKHSSAVYYPGFVILAFVFWWTYLEDRLIIQGVGWAEMLSLDILIIVSWHGKIPCSYCHMHATEQHLSCTPLLRVTETTRGILFICFPAHIKVDITHNVRYFTLRYGGTYGSIKISGTFIHAWMRYVYWFTTVAIVKSVLKTESAWN